ncbi:Crp/Fnr family transcriptional regulator [Rhodopila sp.]|jgi:CRP-like cAMP-binding protein|uniref:Crp/Fnr family transcriptional regulator n=1 Tax=Rhodopila sp. TaxID=2480087 RepID=UPI002B7A2023|nr:Crp/Fnr family transcriptional regulator [Rhodopila sp.]HVZ10405.1 Crp/Fnr family transcriptional regulator [Rhodopila sp.]
MDRKDAESVARSWGWLSQQPRGVQNEVLRRSRLMHVDTGTLLYQIDDTGGGIYGVAEGAIGIHVASPSTGSTLAHIVRRGFWFGHAPILARRGRAAAARAAGPSCLIYLPLREMERLSRSSTAFTRALASLSDDAFRVAAGVITDLLIRRADCRIAATLLRVTGALEACAPDAPAGFRLTQAELGEMANASRHLVNRTLGRFEANGWVSRSYSYIAICQPESLAAFVRDGE